MQELFSNNAITTLASSVASGDTTINLATGTGVLFPNPTVGSQFFRVTLVDSLTKSYNEILICTARTGDVLTVIRAQEGTAALSWLAGDIASNQLTAGAMINVYSPSADQQNAVRYAVDTGTANNYLVALNPALPTGVSGVKVIFKAANANTGASTININSGTVYNIVSQQGAALIGGEIQANSIVTLDFNGAGYALISATGTQTQTSLTQLASDNTTKNATTAYVQESIVGGIGQSYNDVTSSRALGTTPQTNNTGRAIHVNVSAIVTTGSSAALTMIARVNGNLAAQAVFFVGTGLEGGILSFIVPNGQTYYVTATANTGTVSLTKWLELR